MVRLLMYAFGKLGPSAQGFLQSLADVACSTGVVDRGLWLRIAQQVVLCFGGVALSFVTTIRILLKVLERLSCCCAIKVNVDASRFLACFVFRGL